MNKRYRSPTRRLLKGLTATIAALSLLLIITASALANTVNIDDRAGVLNRSQVYNEASSLPYRLDIYTIPNFTGPQVDLDARTKNSLRNSSMLVMAIDTGQHHFAIAGGSSVSSSGNLYNDAYQAFRNGYSSGGYTNATISAIRALKSDLNTSGGFLSGVPGGIGGGAGCLVGLLVIAGIALFAITRRRRVGGYVNTPVMAPPLYNPNPYNQGYPPGYNQGYPQGYNQGQGINPLAAGGLGAAAGGLIGYELGRESGEREGQGGFGGGAGGDFGGGGGGGGDFGGGAGGDFGGGGGGGGDNGGGGSF